MFWLSSSVFQGLQSAVDELDVEYACFVHFYLVAEWIVCAY